MSQLGIFGGFFCLFGGVGGLFLLFLLSLLWLLFLFCFLMEKNHKAILVSSNN